MKNISQIYIVLSFFIYIISCSVIYMILKDIVNNRFNKKVDKLKGTFGNEVLKQLTSVRIQKGISRIDINKIDMKLDKKCYFKAFNNAIMEFNNNKDNHKFTRTYLENFEAVIIKKIKKVSKKDDIVKNYQAFLLGEYRLNNFEINKFLFDCMESKSVYLRVTSLKSISKIGNINNFVEALLYISNENKYIHNKVLLDIINQFEGDKIILNHTLMDKFYLFNTGIKKIIIEEFKNSDFTSVKDKLLTLLKDEKCEKEIKISIIKYFSSIKYNEVKSEIIKFLGEKDWEYRAICSTALSNYKDEKSKVALLKSINDKNWHVRYNSAISLLKFKDSNIVDIILNQNDKYSKEILIYAMFMENKISYEEYLQKFKKVEVESIC